MNPLMGLVAWWFISGMARRRRVSQHYCWWALLGLIGLVIAAIYLNSKYKVQPARNIHEEALGEDQ